MRHRSLGLIIIPLAIGPLLAQQEDPTFSTEVKVVNVLATVRNKQGEIFRDLTKDDFSILENGKPETIRYFARQTDLPLTVGLMVDTSMSQEHVLDSERGASLRFIDQVLRETKDKFFIMQFDLTVQVRQALTASRSKLDDALAYVNTPTRNELQHQSGGGTLLYDAVLQASNDILSRQQGRKALIVLSDGVDTGSEVSATAAIEAAQRADTLIYSILFSDANAYNVPLFHHSLSMGGFEGRAVLVRMARETGGSFLEVSKKVSIEQIFDVIQDELRSQYSLGFVSDQPVRVSEFHKLQVLTSQKGLVVQSRERYWAKP